MIQGLTHLMEQNGGLFAALRREDVMEDWRNICQEIAVSPHWHRASISYADHE